MDKDVPIGNLISLSLNETPPRHVAVKDDDKCPTGLLIDMSDAVQVPFANDFLRVGEFDDTFGIFKALVPVPTANTSDDSDSLLDVNNLSSFSISDTTDEYLDHLHSIETPKIEVIDNANQIQDEEVKSRRESINRKLQRLSTLISSPIPSPPSCSTHFQPTPISLRSWTQNTSTSKPFENENNCRISTIVDSANNKLETKNIFCTPISSTRVQVASPVIPIAFEKGISLLRDSTDSTTSFIRKLSFDSTNNTNSSGSISSSSKKEPIFGIPKERISLMFPIKPIASVRGAPKRPTGVRAPNQPLKATASLNTTVIESDAEQKQKKFESDHIKKIGCASAPVTRKFSTPVASSSPYKSNTSINITPSRNGRKSFTAVKSSGYGQQSPNTSIYKHKIPLESPIGKSVPNQKPLTGPRKLPTPSRPVMGVRGQIPVFCEPTKPIGTLKNPLIKVKPAEIDSAIGGLRFGFKPPTKTMSKENRLT